MKVRFLFNPKSGPASSRPGFEKRLHRWAEANGYAKSIVMTERGGHATELARACVAEGCTRVVAIGGDGTLNEVGHGLMATSVELAVVPRGSGNGLARHLGIPQSPEKALALAASPSAGTRRIDAGLCEGLPFFNVMGLGLDAEIARRFSSSPKRGFVSYVLTTLAAWRTAQAEALTVEVDGKSSAVQSLIFAVANSAQYGNGVQIAPRAEVDDGELEGVSLGRLGLVGGLLTGVSLFRGTADNRPEVTRFPGHSFVIVRGGPGWVHRDGEAALAGPVLRIEVRSKALTMVVPASP